MSRRTVVVVIAAVAASVLALLAVQRAPAPAPSSSGTRTEQPGVAGPPRFGPPAAAPQPWTGIEWRSVETRGFDLEPGLSVSRLVAVPGGLLAIGMGKLNAPNPDGLNSTLTAWVSADGVTWQGSAMLAGVEPGNVTEGRAIAAGPRGVVIGGSTCCRKEETAVWFSADGASWVRTSFPGLAQTYITAAAASDAGFVIIGSDGLRGRIWASPDGMEWSEVEAAAAGLAKGELSDVVAAGDGFLVAGMDDARGIDSHAALWASTGLANWRRIAANDAALSGPDEASLYRVVPFAAGLFASGGSGTQNERLGCERLLQGGLLTAGPATALSCGWLREMTWRSGDGAAWERIDPWGVDGVYPPDLVGPPPGRAQVGWHGIIAAGPGLVGVQEELIGNVNNEGGVGTWASADGKTWQRIGEGPRQGDVVVSVIAIEQGLLAITEGGVIWLGTAS